MPSNEQPDGFQWNQQKPRTHKPRKALVSCVECENALWTVFHHCLYCHGYDICSTCHTKRNDPFLVANRLSCEQQGHDILTMLGCSVYDEYRRTYRNQDLPLPLSCAFDTEEQLRSDLEERRVKESRGGSKRC
jgi:hypothetical protein